MPKRFANVRHLTIALATAAGAFVVIGAGAAASVGAPLRVHLEPVASGLTVPIFLTEPDDGSDRLFIVDQPGLIRVLEDGELRDEPFLDLRASVVALDPEYDERGLLGLAFHPQYAENRRLFVYYSRPLRAEAPDGWDHTSRISEFHVSEDDPNRADPASERVVLEVDQPFANHNAGHIGFGPDGYLYIPLGDGGNGGDVDPPDDDRGRPEKGHGQTITTLLGSVLRIDVDGEEPYGIPADNPFVGQEGEDEIWAYGFRNPYGLSFDRETGDLYLANAGQLLYEEANLVERGGNYGWNIKEGLHCFNPNEWSDEPSDCPDVGSRGEPLLDPVVEYQRGPDSGSTIVAGVLYRGQRVPELRDRFVFGDYGFIRFDASGGLYAARRADERPWPQERVQVANSFDGRADGELERFLLGVTQDLEGELYVLTTQEGGPTGSTGQVFAVYPERGPDEAWWPRALLWAAAGLALVALVVGGIPRLRRRA